MGIVRWISWRAFVEAIHVLLALEYLAFVNADTFEDAVTIEEAVVVNTDHRLALGEHLAVGPRADGGGDDRPITPQAAIRPPLRGLGHARP